jgi:hypothetical protein
MNMKCKYLLLFVLFLVQTNLLHSQSIIQVNPSMAVQGQTLDVSITGMNTHFAQGSPTNVWFSQGSNTTISSTTIVPINDTLLKAKMSIPINANLGAYSTNIYTVSDSNLIKVNNFSIQAPSPISGVKTIGPRGDYTSFSNAVSALVGHGINGPVIFNVADSVYHEQVIIPSISGSSPINTITFQSQSMDSSKVTLSYNSTQSDTNYTLLLDGAKNIYFKKIGIAATGINYGTVVTCESPTDSIYFLNCRIEGSVHSVQSGPFKGILYVTNGKYFEIKNCHFEYCSDVLDIKGQVSSSQYFEITNNTFLNFQGKAIEAYRIYGKISNNHIEAGSTSSPYECVRLYTPRDSLWFTSNKVINESTTGISLKLYTYEGTSSTPIIVANNFFTSNANSSLIVFYSSSYVHFIHNTVYAYNSTNYSYCMHLDEGPYPSSNNYILNNVFRNNSSGRMYYADSSAYAYTMNYNSYYNTGVFFDSDDDTSYSSFADWQASGQDSNSMVYLPQFASNTDLHTSSLLLNGKAQPSSIVTHDIDGDLRSYSSPDIGADEFTPSCSPLSGTYTIGTSGDYYNFNDAVAALSLCGINAPVVFNVLPGTYTEQVTIPQITGASATNTITFQSSTGDSTDVILQFTATDNSDNFVLYGFQSKHLRFKQMTFKSLSPSFSTMIKLSNYCQDVQFKSCVFQSASTINNNSIYGAITNIYGYDMNDILFENNHFEGGNYGIFMNGSNTQRSKRLIIKNNVFRNTSYYGVYLQRVDSISVIGNELTGLDNAWAFEAIYYAHFQGYGRISDNVIINRATANFYGISIHYKSSTFTDPLVVFNNFITSTRSVQYYTGGLMVSLSSNVNVYFNTIRIKGDMANGSYPMNLRTSEGIKAHNNIFFNENQGYAYYIDSLNTIQSSSHNCLFTSGTYLAHLQGDFTSLSSLNSITSMESSSIQANPFFNDSIDYHPKNFLVNGAALPISGITEDIDGITRDATNPDMGAAEITLPPNDAGILSLTASDACEGQQTITAELTNFGAANLSSVTIHWEVNDVAQTPYAWTGNLATGDTVFVVLTTQWYSSSASSYDFKSYTSSPNAATDGFLENDTFFLANNTFHALTPVSITGLATAYCASDPAVILTASPSGGSFTVNGLGASQLLPSTGAGIYEVIYTYSNVNACFSYDTVTTLVNANPTVEILSSLNSSYCSNESAVTLSATPSGGSYSGAVSSAYFDPSVLGNGQQSIVYTYVDGNGCSNADSVSIEVFTAPTVQISSSLDSFYCDNNSSVSLSASPTGGVFSGNGVIGNNFDPHQASLGAVDITVYLYRWKWMFK